MWVWNTTVPVCVALDVSAQLLITLSAAHLERLEALQVAAAEADEEAYLCGATHMGMDSAVHRGRGRAMCTVVLSNSVVCALCRVCGPEAHTAQKHTKHAPTARTADCTSHASLACATHGAADQQTYSRPVHLVDSIRC